MKTIVLATHNSGKVAEFNDLLIPYSFEVISLSRLSISSVEETGQTFVENAIIKARHAALFSGLPALADDSGLEVDVLQGSPGVHSARFAGLAATDQENINKLIDHLKGVEFASRSARFHCVLVFMRHADDPVPLIAEGRWEGFILEEPRGMNGFGYDPLFWIPHLGCSAAELSFEQKNLISHRSLAFQSLLLKFQQYL
ncbi:MAG: RdgB/HAM1 family non-canonical purine NTP pyrophosphatase [Methylococcaceae bacterium]